MLRRCHSPSKTWSSLGESGFVAQEEAAHLKVAATGAGSYCATEGKRPRAGCGGGFLTLAG